jgi:Domain of unknown function (DUF1843)
MNGESTEEPTNERQESRALRAGDGGPQPPYGPAILDAIATGELQMMKAIAEAARRALYGIEFERVSTANEREVRAALEKLETAIARIDRSSSR